MVVVAAAAVVVVVVVVAVVMVAAAAVWSVAWCGKRRLGVCVGVESGVWACALVYAKRVCETITDVLVVVVVAVAV
jgi:hypothetical protein